MSATRLEKLFFTIELIDKATGGTNKIINQIDKIQSHANKGFANIAKGGAGLFAAGLGLSRLLQPSIELNRALGEVKSLDVAEKTLQGLQRTALSTSILLGEDAANIVRGAYDIQSAIAGLVGNELASFTRASAILAKGTKADTATITDYMGTMFNIFQKDANAIGKSKWVDILAGQTATAVQMFKTTGSKMAAAFVTVGAEGQSNGIKMSEQVAILGQLQATMSGAEAGTKYLSFLQGVGKAQDALNLKFADAQGRMLPMVDILEKLKSKFGETFDVAESDILKKAFGRKEAVGLIKLLMSDIDGLKNNIDTFGNIKGMSQAVKMAEAISDPWRQTEQVIKAVAIVFGQALQPALIPVLSSIRAGAATLMRWIDIAPNLTKLIGGITLGVFALVAAISTFLIVGGLVQLALAGYNGLLLIGAVYTKAKAVSVWLLNSALTWLRGAALATMLQLSLLRAGMLTSTAATWLFNAALWANPITWIVVAIAVLVGALIWMATHWDIVTAAVGRFTDWVKTKFTNLKSWLSSLSIFDIVGAGVQWIIDKINLIPGINISAGAQEEKARINTAAGFSSSGAVQSNAGGGLLQQISNATNNNSGTTVEKIEVNTTGGVSGFHLADELALAGG